ncbi:hypothetical protein OE88DRAFT_1808858 [Heliocybe sulcata]|uniref:Uncharacterized protein n=1 Tax=Heliocybe sulcata TaxID=5364 RepID=A0A5C3N0M0_9AGAM|nr:hypothetical protein OE88DRAFT_1808858 [Heliocybe sulcata]
MNPSWPSHAHLWVPSHLSITCNASSVSEAGRSMQSHAIMHTGLLVAASLDCLMMYGILLLLHGWTALALADSMSNATCTDSSLTYLNSLGQSQCYLAYRILKISQDITFLPALDKTSYYPMANSTCNGVAYNIFSACTACQGDYWGDWLDWQNTCDVLGFPASNGFTQDIPSGVAIPHWAYYNYSGGVNDTEFNNSVPNLVGEFPEITGVPSDDSTTTVTSSTAAATSSDSASSPTLSFVPIPTVPAKSRVNPGVIAGGVVGGFVLAGLCALAIGAFVMQQKRGQRRTSDSGSDAPYVAPFKGKLYDPSDPSTYPEETPKTSEAAVYDGVRGSFTSNDLASTAVSSYGVQTRTSSSQPPDVVLSSPGDKQVAIMSATRTRGDSSVPTGSHASLGRFTGLPEV